MPWLARLRKKGRRIPVRVHYDAQGQPYRPQFLDGYEDRDYPPEDEDLEWLVQGGFPRTRTKSDF